MQSVIFIEIHESVVSGKTKHLLEWLTKKTRDAHIRFDQRGLCVQNALAIAHQIYTFIKHINGENHKPSTSAKHKLNIASSTNI